MPWWAWAIAGLILLCAEMFVPADFFLFFIGAAGLFVGILSYLGLSHPYWLQWVLCSVFSITLLYSARPWLLKKVHASGAKARDLLEDEQVLVAEDIHSGKEGTGETRGTVWTVRNLSNNVLEKGKRYQISGRDGIVLIVKG